MSKALLAVIGAVCVSAAFGQDCSIDGSVVNSLTNAPILRAHINVAGTGDTALADTDAGGRWRIEHLACGRVTVTVTRPGFLRPQPDASLTLVAGTPRHDVKFELVPQAVLTGHILDDQGDPLPGAQVSLMTTRVINGVRGVQASSSMITNDLGEFRFAGLSAGRYFLCGNGPPQAIVEGSPQWGERCYPGPIEGGAAAAMDVLAGSEGRVDIAIARLPLFHVSGTVSGFPEGGNGLVTLTPKSLARMFGAPASIHADGSFSFRGIAPGSYTIAARAGLLNDRMMAQAPVVIAGRDVDGIRLQLETGVTVTGTLRVITTSAKKPENPRFMVLLRGANGAVGPGPGGWGGWDEAKRSFSLDDVMPGSYRLEFSPPAPFYLKSATLAGRDMVASDAVIGPGTNAIEMTIGDDGGAVEGDVSANDAPAAGWVFLERGGVPSRNARTDTNGHFKIDGLAPGDYKVYAWDDNANVEYANPDWMQRNGKGVEASVAAGQSAQVKLVRQTAPRE